MVTHLLKILIDEIEDQYVLSGKKFLVLYEMEKTRNIQKFTDLRVKLRYLPKSHIKSQGCDFRNFSYKFCLKKV